MEEELGFALVDHQRKNSFQLTPAGECFLKFAEETVHSYKETLYECNKLQSQPRQQFTLGIEQFDMHYLNREKIISIQKNAEQIDLHFEYSMHADLLDHLYKNDFDCVFIAKPAILPSEYVFREITTDGFMCVFRNQSGLSETPLTFSDISDYQIYLPKDSYTDFISLEQELRSSHPGIQLHTYQTINFLSADNDSCIYITNAGKHFLFHELRWAPLVTQQKLHLGFVYRKDQNIELIEKLAECVHD